MAKIVARPNIDLNLTFTINEGEARALDALVGYDFDAFLKMFKTGMGTHYIEGHEEDLRGFFSDIRSIVGPAISRVDAARKEFCK